MMFDRVEDVTHRWNLLRHISDAIFVIASFSWLAQLLAQSPLDHRS
jgi:hypothetical protein